MSQQPALATLYSFRRCPYAMRARMAILIANKQVILREVLLKDKPDEMLAASPKATVPVLVLPDGAVIEQSLLIMQWAFGSIPNAEQTALIEQNDGKFKHHLDRYKYANRYQEVDPTDHQAAAMSFLGLLDQRLQQNEYLFGDDPTFADLAIFPFVRQFAAVNKNWFLDEAPKFVQNWLAKWLVTAEFSSIMIKIPPWSAGDPDTLFPVKEDQNEI